MLVLFQVYIDYYSQFLFLEFMQVSLLVIFVMRSSHVLKMCGFEIYCLTFYLLTLNRKVQM